MKGEVKPILPKHFVVPDRVPKSKIQGHSSDTDERNLDEENFENEDTSRDAFDSDREDEDFDEGQSELRDELADSYEATEEKDPAPISFDSSLQEEKEEQARLKRNWIKAHF